MTFLKQQVLFVLVTILSVFSFYLYQNDVRALMTLPESYTRMLAYKLVFAAFINYGLISLFYLLLRAYPVLISFFFSN
ncbi:hypothetical protein QR665_19725 [Acinetobacter gerneri]|uniref:hypothetical protein n=1 Tax=Acinetobacter gerneri TaxID=202952 RepID=UPI002935362A|nr:hypothetical protein [Acinetobacter gerneri]MDV2441666.1 hypothetical protein [Acinetobacter gerneri]